MSFCPNRSIEGNDPLWLASYHPASSSALKTLLALSQGVCCRRWNSHEKSPHHYPHCTTEEILIKFHAPHQGTEKTMLRAKTLAYWRRLNKDIYEITKTCSTCQELQLSHQREPLIITEVPPRAWHTIGTDLFTLEGTDHLAVADCYLKYSFVCQIPRGQSKSHVVVKMLRQIW